MINDIHCHFFSQPFFAALARQTGREPVPSVSELCAELAWDSPGDAGALADRWVQELDTHGVQRAAVIASVPGDEASVSAAVAKHPSRFVGFFMIDPSSADAVVRTTDATTRLGLKGVCLFPAMHRVALEDARIERIVMAAANVPGTIVFVHCGALSVGVRQRLGLPSPFDLSLGNPAGVARLATMFPETTFVIPHFGAGRLHDALEAAGRCPNIVLDTSSSNGWIRQTPGLTLKDVFDQVLGTIGVSRLVFGTDSSFFPRGWQRSVYDEQRRALDACGVGAADQSLILGGNFDRVFA